MILILAPQVLLDYWVCCELLNVCDAMYHTSRVSRYTPQQYVFYFYTVIRVRATRRVQGGASALVLGPS